MLTNTNFLYDVKSLYQEMTGSDDACNAPVVIMATAAAAAGQNIQQSPM